MPAKKRRQPKRFPERLIMSRRDVKVAPARVGEATKTIANVVVTSDPSMRPAKGAAVRFRVVAGEVEIVGKRKSRLVRTNEEGIAGVRVRPLNRGRSIIVAELVDDPRQMIGTAVRTDGATWELQLRAKPTFAVGEMHKVRIIAVDHEWTPVTGAELRLTAHALPDLRVKGSVREIGEGVYEGTFLTYRAGAWTVTVQDLRSGAVGHLSVQGLAGEACGILVYGETDPRATHPRNELTLRTQLIDRFGNPLDPDRLIASIGGDPTPKRLFRDEAWFTVKRDGYGYETVHVADSETPVAIEKEIFFAAASLEDPGFVEIGKLYETRLHGFLPVGRSGREAIVEIRFNPELTRFVRYNPDDQHGGEIQSSAAVDEPGLLRIGINAERKISWKAHPEGIAIGIVTWECIGEGETCLTVTGHMSPGTDPWTLCFEQKQTIAKNVCVNIIYPPGNAAAKAAGETAAQTIESALSARKNVDKCCPILRLDLHSCEIPDEEWRDDVIRATGGDGTISSNDEWEEVVDLDTCKRDDCINMWMLEFDHPTAGGLTREGDSALDPDLPTSNANYGAHEIGHSLGLGDKYKRRPDGTIDGGPAGNVMSYPIGDELDEDQCKTMWERADDYSG